MSSKLITGFGMSIIRITALVIVICLVSLPSFQTSSGKGFQNAVEIYKLYPNGLAEVTVIVNLKKGVEVCNITAEPRIIPETLQAITSTGLPLYTILQGNVVRVEVFNLSNTVIITYDAQIGNITNGYLVEDELHPFLKATVYLPLNSALVNASGYPNISIVNSTITLRYTTPGTYKIMFITIPISSSTSSSGLETSSSEKWPGNQALLVNTSLLTWVIISLGGIIAGIFALILRRLRKKVELQFLGKLDDRDLKILEILKDREMSISELSRALNLNKSVVWRRVKRLKGQNLLELRIDKGRTLYHLTDKGKNLLNEHASK